MEQYFPPGWFYDMAWRSWRFRKGGVFEPGLVPDPEVTIDIQDTEVELLIKALDEAGGIKPRLDERLRVEDLKITHRLLDLLEKKK